MLNSTQLAAPRGSAVWLSFATRAFICLLCIGALAAARPCLAQSGKDSGDGPSAQTDDPNGGADSGDDGTGREGAPIVPAQGVGKLDLEKLFSKKPKPPKKDTCYVRADGGALVAKVLAEFEGERLVKLPTGELEVIADKDTRPTDRPFVSATRQQMIDHHKAGKFGEFNFVPAGYYIFAYKDGDEDFYMQTRSILESLFPGVIKQLRDWGLKPTRPETPMLVVMMPNRAEFDALEKMPPGVAAYYTQLENYVVLYQDTKLFEAAPEYAFREVAYTIAHEGIHQILANTGIQRRLSVWPAWVSEGLPEYFCPLKVSSRVIRQSDGEKLPERAVKWQRAGVINDVRLYHLLRTRGASGKLIEQSIQTGGSLTAYGYAVSWGLVHYLGERRPEKFAAYLRDISSKSKPLQPNVPLDHRGPDPLFVKHFGDDYPELEASVQRHLNSKEVQKQYKDPVANQTHYVVKATIKKSGRYMTSMGLTKSPAAAKEFIDKLKAKARAEGLTQATFLTIVCKSEREALARLAK
ncbi:MAG: DUF1570 domain-containing protein [Planctomycetota bacterium]